MGTRIKPSVMGESLSEQCKAVRKEKRGKRLKNKKPGNRGGVDVRGLNAEERKTLNMIKLKGWL